MCVCVCVCVNEYVCACMNVCVRARVCVSVTVWGCSYIIVTAGGLNIDHYTQFDLHVVRVLANLLNCPFVCLPLCVLNCPSVCLSLFIVI